ncbi:hypothetical protein [Demequina globuliformis]|uniref:hypothetical protein n=1 Tax=Demequina globuliformis TaxID=676202 RepID=UPI00128B2270|nr:hypothetical protein [Demequina globuliformis]
MSFSIELPDGLASEREKQSLEVELVRALRRTRRHSTATTGGVDALLEMSGLDAEHLASAKAKLKHPGVASAATTADVVARQVRVVNSTISTAAVAKILGVTPTTVTRKVESKFLLARRSGARRAFAFPAWQFTDHSALPGWDEVAPALTGVEWRAVEAFVTAPREELDDASVRDWLIAGKDPSVVVSLAESLVRW